MIVITGASDGLGREIAKLYHEQSEVVVSVSRRKCDYADYNIIVDLSKEEGVREAVQKIEMIRQPIDALILNAGVLTLESLGRVTWSEIDRVMRINSHSPIFFISLLIERLRQEASDIVAIGSTAAINSYKGQPVYSASKSALRGFTNDLRAEFEGTPNRVIGVYPGMFDSEISQKMPGENVSKSKKPVIDTKQLAKLVHATLALPKVMEVSDIVINRKVVRD